MTVVERHDSISMGGKRKEITDRVSEAAIGWEKVVRRFRDHAPASDSIAWQ